MRLVDALLEYPDDAVGKAHLVQLIDDDLFVDRCVEVLD